MEEKTYLKWYNKVGYGTGDIAGNVVYAFLSSFVMIYLTNTVGLNSGIVGTLIAVSKLFDGVTDIFFGTMIDHTKSKMGKARPWMFYGFFGCAITLFGVFAIPTSLGKTAQYAWFFIAYTLLNAVFYTANNIAYAALTSLVTKNSKERVQMGSFRFMFSFGTNLVIQSVTVGAVEMFGGGAAAWRTIAFIYCIIGIITNTLAVFSVKELSDEELKDDSVAGEEDDKLSFKQIIKLLFNSRTDSSAKTLRIEKNDKAFAFSCLPYTASEIENATHHEELPPARRTVLCVYGAVRGVGGIDSWGSDVEDDYRINAEKDIHYSFIIR